MRTINITTLHSLTLAELKEITDAEELAITVKGEPLAVLVSYSKFLKIVDDLQRAEEQLKNISSGHLKEILTEPGTKQ